jgi:hypothetical protein
MMMRSAGYLFLMLLFLLAPGILIKGEVFDVDTIAYNGDIGKRINIVYMGDGYTMAEQEKFITDVNNANAVLFSTSPYSEYAGFFNVFAIRVISNESGAKHPNTATDCPTGSNYMPTTDPDNYFGSSFDRGGIHRLLYITNWVNYYSALADNFPRYDEVIVIVNTPYYGGGGGALAVASAHSSSPQLVIHELGHSFGRLGDEYDSGTCLGGEGPNYTQETERDLIRWRAWIEDDTPVPTANGTYCDRIGLYEGAHYCPTGSYRPKCNCTMRSLNHPFCEVCREHIILQIHQMVDLIESYSPVQGADELCDPATDLAFWAAVVRNSPNTIGTTWILDEVPVAADTEHCTLPVTSLSPGIHHLRLEARDTTEAVKGFEIVTCQDWYISTGASIQVTFSPLPDMCINDGPYLLTEGSPEGGYYVSDYVRGDDFHPILSGTGTHTIEYVYRDMAGCRYSASQSVTVYPVYETSVPASICQGDTILLGGAFRSEAGIYYDTLQAAGGCDSIIITELTVHPAYEAHQTAEICAGDSILLGGEWRIATGLYYDSLHTVAGCDSVHITELMVNALPDVSLGNDTAITTSDTLVLDAGNGFVDYLWNNGSEEQIFRILNLKTGDYIFSVLVTDTSGCKGSDTIHIHVEIPGPVPAAWTDLELEIYPNPTTGYLVIKSNSDFQRELEISLVDNSGRIILEKRVSELKTIDEIVLDLSGFEEGFYYLLINNHTLFTVQKLIKNR